MNESLPRLEAEVAELRRLMEEQSAVILSYQRLLEETAVNFIWVRQKMEVVELRLCRLEPSKPTKERLAAVPGFNGTPPRKEPCHVNTSWCESMAQSAADVADPLGMISREIVELQKPFNRIASEIADLQQQLEMMNETVDELARVQRRNDDGDAPATTVDLSGFKPL